MNLKEIKELIKIVDSSNLSELHIEQEDLKLTLKKEIIVQQINNIDRNDYIIRETRVDSEVPVAPQAAKEIVEDLHIIKSPIVGIFYGSANPEAPSFVTVGDRVKVGQVLCIVEAMKLMNEITSDVEGELVEILGQNQGTVEFGQPLFKIRKV